MTKNTSGTDTRVLQDEMWKAAGAEYDKEYEFDELLEKLNSPDFFAPFAMRLLTFYNSVLKQDFTAEEAAKDLLQRGASLNRNTVKNWFTGKNEPKYGDNDRRNMFAVAFALGLDIVQTERLFHKVYLDKAFNARSINEYIYFYCIKNNRPLSAADALIEQASVICKTTTETEHTKETQMLINAAIQSADDTEFLQSITDNTHNFSLNNTAALKHRNRLLKVLTGNTHKGLAQQEYERRNTEQQKAEYRAKMGQNDQSTPAKCFELKFDNRNPQSIEFLLYIIMDLDMEDSGGNAVMQLREKFQRKEIYNQFPNKQTLTKKDPSSYVLRKDIILLQFYYYWVMDYLKSSSDCHYDGFIEELNDILYDCGFSALYAGNPYDWLFMYCSACAGQSNPLDIFRGIIAPAV